MAGFVIMMVVLFICITFVVCVLGWKCLDEQNDFFYHDRFRKIEDRLSELEKDMKIIKERGDE